MLYKKELSRRWCSKLAVVCLSIVVISDHPPPHPNGGNDNDSTVAIPQRCPFADVFFFSGGNNSSSTGNISRKGGDEDIDNGGTDYLSKVAMHRIA